MLALKRNVQHVIYPITYIVIYIFEIESETRIKLSSTCNIIRKDKHGYDILNLVSSLLVSFQIISCIGL